MKTAIFILALLCSSNVFAYSAYENLVDTLREERQDSQMREQNALLEQQNTILKMQQHAQSWRY